MAAGGAKNAWRHDGRRENTSSFAYKSVGGPDADLDKIRAYSDNSGARWYDEGRHS